MGSSAVGVGAGFCAKEMASARRLKLIADASVVSAEVEDLGLFRCARALQRERVDLEIDREDLPYGIDALGMLWSRRWLCTGRATMDRTSA